MRIWDQIHPSKLCRKHLLGEHREIHCVWVFLTTDKGGNYKKHPEVLRWKDNWQALYIRHEYIAQEMINRGYKHKSKIDLPASLQVFVTPENIIFPPPLDDQIAKLKAKNCECNI